MRLSAADSLPAWCKASAPPRVWLTPWAVESAAAFDHPGESRARQWAPRAPARSKPSKGIYGQIDKLKTNPISDEEIKRAKDSILNSFVFNFDSPEKVLRERMAYEFYGYPADFLERFRSASRKSPGR